MKRKVFISYSHKDDSHKNKFITHLSSLVRNEEIEIWHDRKILPSQDWSKEISEKLESSDIVICLISADFIASTYCYGKELSRSLELQEEGKLKCICIILKPCDWHDLPLSKFQCIPEDGKPITKWSNQDSAWLDCTKKIKSTLPLCLTGPSSNITAPILSNKMITWLDDTEITLVHRRMTKVKLKDIYVPQTLTKKKSLIGDRQIRLNTEELLTEGRHLISGDEQQGKTSILKYLFNITKERGLIPLYLDIQSIKTFDIDDAIDKAKKSHYSNSKNLSYDKDKTVLLIDNIEGVQKFNDKQKRKFFESTNAFTGILIATCDNAFSCIVNQESNFDDYVKYGLCVFGHEKRNRLVEKWIELGNVNTMSEQEILHACDDYNSRLDSIIGKNIVPPKPIYILMLLQMFEATTAQKLDLTSHGHCYQHLIYKSFELADIGKNEIEKYLNILTEISWNIYKNNGQITSIQLHDFFKKYRSEFLLGETDNSIIAKLTTCSILIENEDNISFKYPYLYYFFVAKKIAESIRSDDEIEREIERLLSLLHMEDAANILVFITHHTKEKWIIDKICDSLHVMFNDHKTATLDNHQLSFMKDFISDIKEIVVEQRDHRKDHLDKAIDKDLKSEQEKDEYKDINQSDLFEKINRTFKGMDVVGQIIRNRHSNLKKSDLYKLAKDGSYCGLRFLNFYIEASDFCKDEVVRMISKQLENNPRITDSNITDVAKKMYLQLTFGFIYGIVMKITSSIGSKEAKEIYEQLAKEEKSPAYILMARTIDLYYNKKIDLDSIRETHEELEHNPICDRILKNCVVRHIDMFPLDHKLKQSVTSLLKIKLLPKLPEPRK